MNIADLVFTGFNKRVAALHRDTGEIVWQWRGSSLYPYTTLLLDGDRLIVSVQGCMYALDAATGRELWANEMSGFGYGVASLATVRGGSTPGDHLAICAAHTASTNATSGS